MCLCLQSVKYYLGFLIGFQPDAVYNTGFENIYEGTGGPNRLFYDLEYVFKETICVLARPVCLRFEVDKKTPEND